MRLVLLPGLLGSLAAALALGGCNQDSYASSPGERDTHMGEIHAVAAPAAPSASGSAVPSPSPAMGGAAAPSASR